MALVTHAKTDRQAQLFLKNPAGSLLIIGESGSGKINLARRLSSSLLNLASEDGLDAYPYYHHLKKEDGSKEIAIDAVRQIIRHMRLKTTARGQISRVVLIQDSHRLSPEAQNALLKVLEEPNAGTVFILTASGRQGLLPTIVSRCQIIQVQPASLQQAQEHYKKIQAPSKIISAWQLSQGSAALLDALLKDDNSHPLKIAVEHAKAFLKLSAYDRLLYLDKQVKNKDEYQLFLRALAKTLAAVHQSLVKNGKADQAAKILLARQLVLGSSEFLEQNGSVKLISVNLALNLAV